VTQLASISETRKAAPVRAEVQLDASAISVTRAGVENYYWPIRQSELVDSIKEIAKTFVSVLREPLTQGVDDARILACVSSPIYKDTLTVFAAHLLAAKFSQDGRVPTLPTNNASEWRNAFLGEPLENFKLLSLFERGVARPPTWRRILRPLADVLRPDIYVRRPIEFADMQSDTIAVTLCPLSRRRAAESNTRLTYTPLYEWFYPPMADELRADPRIPISAALRDELVSALEETLRRLGVGQTQKIAESLRMLIDGATAWARFYLRRIERSPRNLPHRLWKGSSGVIWSRILADAVRAAGGTVVGHDHAGGANFYENTLMPFTELQGNSVFVTFTAAYADLYRRMGPDLLIEPKMPQIEYANPATVPRHVTPRPDGQPRSIIYVTPYLANGSMSTVPQMMAPMAYDWQARLFTMLQGMNLEVTQKPHPLSPVPPSPIFENEFGIRTAHERYENIMHNYDVQLFDYTAQTSFGSALCSDLPVVLVDFGTTRYQPDMRAKLARRCAIVKGRFDDDNRAHVDPTDLRIAVNRARELCDFTFVDEVIGL
jgi:hypothetical protein